MKKSLLIASLFTLLAFNNVSAQIPNNSFETWKLDTFYLGAGEISNLPADTITFMDPVSWTSSNTLTGLDSLGGVTFVTQSATAYHGASSVRLTTDTVKLPVIPNFPALNLSIPGFVVNGDFPITAESLVGGGSVISPVSLIGAGQPYSQRLGKIKGYYQYTPVFNTNTGSNDTCLVWATLRKGTTVIADAIFKSTAATSGWQAFEAPFVYSSCDMPDTLVILLASSVPNVATILGGSSGLIPGSVMLVDSIYYETGGSINFPPIARPDLDSTSKNTAKNIDVKANDEDCDDSTPSLSVSVSVQPSFGTTTVVGSGVVQYTPATNYVGVDSFTYSLSDGNTSSTARVRVYVFNSLGINDANQIAVSVYPVPASDVINVQFENRGRTTLRVFDVTGKLVLTSFLTKNNNAVQTAELANGVYGLQIADESNVVISRSKFTISK